MHFLNITASDDPVTTVYVHYLPDEAGDVGIRLALLPFGTVHDISYQRFAGFKNIATGTRIIRMSLNHHIPFQCNIQGYPCRVWYVGQPLKCTICSGAHKAADCPDRNKCKRCKQPGHFARDCQNAWGTTTQAQPDPPAPPAAPNPTPPPASDPPSAPPPPVSATPPASSSVGGTVTSVPPPLMSVNVQLPPQSHVDGLVPSQASLYSETEDSIAEFSEEDSPPVASPSPSISSFTSDSCSQSILKDAPKTQIVSSDPTVVGKFSSECGANSNITGQVVIELDNSNVTGPKVAQGKSNNNVTGPKVAQGNNSNVTGSNVALNKSNSNVTGPKVAPSKSSVAGSKTLNSLNDAPNSQNSQIVDDAMDSESSFSESSFKAPLPPRPRRTPPRALCEVVLVPPWFRFLPVLIGVCLRCPRIGRLDAPSLRVLLPSPYGSVHNIP